MFLPNPWPLDGDRHTPIPQVLLVTQKRPDGWVQVLLPVRPNGTLGWVHAGDVRLTAKPYRIQMSLSGHAIRVTRGTTQLYPGPVAGGAPSTPTAPGRYYTRVLLQDDRPGQRLRTICLRTVGPFPSAQHLRWQRR